ncbi:hypothetical protein DOK67_0001095 [Enterococcus sp. DIV0212c]|uniref:hypothetical protein n=1 Tax=Enterococcus sp. DIV0212c TaxID=2230867 RepID=UPI001A9AA0A4|nr:hypothetical protein [Enterococcus sp. DIV0212c]MBO1354453.1 hypothetical protein [Enterococcus sp. DIV0212c]
MIKPTTKSALMNKKSYYFSSIILLIFWFFYLTKFRMLYEEFYFYLDKSKTIINQTLDFVLFYPTKSIFYLVIEFGLVLASGFMIFIFYKLSENNECIYKKQYKVTAILMSSILVLILIYIGAKKPFVIPTVLFLTLTCILIYSINMITKKESINIFVNPDKYLPGDIVETYGPFKSREDAEFNLSTIIEEYEHFEMTHLNFSGVIECDVEDEEYYIDIIVVQKSS